MDISIVVPLFNEEESLPELEAWIDRVMQEHAFSYELIMVDDGSTDSSWKVIEGLIQKNKHIRAFKFQRNYGKSAALSVGFEAAQGEVVVTMDADLQDSPDEVPELYRMVMEEKYDLVSGWKKKRNDPASKRLPSKVYNRLVRWLTKINLHDFNCGLKAYRRPVVKSISVHGDLHRYIPVLAKIAGFKKIGEKVVQHNARKYGVSKFGLGRARGMFDLLTLAFIGRFAKKPMHFFGTLGTLFFFIGFVLLVYLSIAKLIYQEYGIADRPLFYFGIVTLIVGSQLFLTGFLAEMITRNNQDNNTYVIEKIINPTEKE
jgi:glycosyltransferase involved in cell wall biosynthesis